jgi:UDP-glucose 4-epimerase
LTRTTNSVASAECSSLLRDAYRQRKVLVVGADGFLGMNCVYALKELQADVSLFTRRAATRVRDFHGITFHGDLRDRRATHNALEKQTIVFDFAGTMGAVESNQEPEESLDQECRAQLSLFQACAETRNPPLVLFCSSRLVYGKPQYLPVDEAHALNPQSIYAVHKITAENYLRVFGQTRGLPHCTIRLSNPYGPHQQVGTKGYGIINRFLWTAARGEPIRIFGEGHQLRDYIHVDDVVTAFLLAGVEQRCRGQIFNLGGRQPVSLQSAARRISELAGGTEIRYEPWPREQQGVETGDYVTDMTRIDSLLKLPPSVDWDEGLVHALKFYRREWEIAQPGIAGLLRQRATIPAGAEVKR